METAVNRCAACSAELRDDASECPQCGATVYPSARMTLLTELQELSDVHAAQMPGDAAPAESPTPSTPAHKAWRAAAWTLAGLIVIGGAAWAWQHFKGDNVSAYALREAVENAMREGAGPGTEPVCVANGLAYDNTPVHVQLDNDVTTAWMEALVAAELYEVVPDAQAFTKEGAAVRDYRPLPALADWGGARRLCMARAVRVKAVRNLGPIEPMRFRGEAFTGITADVVWTMVDPAPWLAKPAAAAAMVNQWPAWRGARWAVGPEGWTMVQRRHFFLQDDRWYTAESLERRNDLPPRPPPPL